MQCLLFYYKPLNPPMEAQGPVFSDRRLVRAHARSLSHRKEAIIAYLSECADGFLNTFTIQMTDLCHRASGPMAAAYMGRPTGTDEFSRMKLPPHLSDESNLPGPKIQEKVDLRSTWVAVGVARPLGKQHLLHPNSNPYPGLIIMMSFVM